MSNQRGSIAAGTSQISFFVVNKRKGLARRRNGRKQKETANKPSAKVSISGMYPTGRTKGSQRSKKMGPGQNQSAQLKFFEMPSGKGRSDEQTLPSQRQIKLSKDFSPAELQRLSVQLGLGEAAVSRHLRELGGNSDRGIGHSDPRPADWARADLKNFRFLTEQLSKARRGQGYIDTSALKKPELVDLWEFTKFEADRALRNIDQLRSGLSHLKGATADYLVDGHRLEARFYSFLAGQLEPLISTKAYDQYLQD